MLIRKLFLGWVSGVLAMTLFAGAASAVYNEPGESAPVGDADFDAGLHAVKSQQWETAIARLEAAAKRHRRSADVYSLLGFAYRKSGRLDASFENYYRALDIDPRHRGAHEYIGEAYLMRNDVPRATAHLRELEHVCGVICEEYRDLKRAIDEHQKNNVPR